MSKKMDIGTLIAGGVVGAALGAILTNKPKNLMISAVLGAAVTATYEASQRAKGNQLPILFEDDGILWRREPNGQIKKIKSLPIADRKFDREFYLG